MGKAKAETTLGTELLSSRLFKPNQGRMVRQGTAVAVAVLFLAAAWRLRVTILSDAPQWLNLSLPAVVAVLGCWFAFRLVSWPRFANFLISVEAEMDKVSWASWRYLKRATGVVLVTMVVLAAYLFTWDIIWQQIFGFVGFLDLEALDT
jgi:preprotein translocase subunit SecE